VRWKLFDNADSLSLGFSSPKDALNFSREIAEDGKHWTASKHWNIAERYAKGHINVVVRCRVADHPRNYDFIFSSIPTGRLISKYRFVKRGPSNEIRLSDVDSRLDDGSVFMNVANLVEGPEGRIPSLVWLQGHKYSLDFVRYVHSFRFELAAKVASRIAKRKSCFIPESSRNDCASAMIQRRPQVLYGGNRSLDDMGGQASFKANLVLHVNTLGVKLGNSFITVRSKKSATQRLQVFDVLFCPANTFKSRSKFLGDF
jgi:hypothetical protein